MPIFIKIILKNRQNNFLVGCTGEIAIPCNVYKKTTTVTPVNIYKRMISIRPNIYKGTTVTIYETTVFQSKGRIQSKYCKKIRYKYL